MFELWALEEMGLPRVFTEILAKEILAEPLALQFRNGYEANRSHQLLRHFRKQCCAKAFRISDRGFILVIVPRRKPTPASLDNILMLRVPLTGDEWYPEIVKILRDQSKPLSSAHFRGHGAGPGQGYGPADAEGYIKLLEGNEHILLSGMPGHKPDLTFEENLQDLFGEDEVDNNE